ncbi:MAG TPA: M36 family metallopeptidase [Ideonella sp.]|uniref:M36 family metallopeptidase n=1 Tax=Ideonella sp. TaxID=1929293 RepID=UPI002BAAB920|nr:M36 family metallopeptidase [Ideonella sp.]HSI49786.1 M36 family metallopeptidase [Ideonella sp.]
MRQFALGAVAALFAASSFAAPAASPISGRFVSADKPNFDANAQAAAVATTSLRQNVEARKSRFGFASHYDAQLGTTFLWATKGNNQSTLKTSLTGASLREATARHFLSRNASALGLSASAISNAKLFDTQDLGTGPVISRFRQHVGGVEVFNRDINVMTDRSGRLVAISGYFAQQSDAASARAASFSLKESTAITKAFADLGGSVADSFAAGATKGAYSTWKRPAGQGDLQLESDPRVKKVMYALGSSLLPAYYVELSAATRDGGTQADYAYVVSAADGAVLFRMNQEAHDSAVTYRMFADKNGVPYDSPLGNGMVPFKKDLPTQTVKRTDAASNLVTVNSVGISTNDPWLAAGATTPVGNNVSAYLDLASPNGFQARRGDVQPTTTSTATFDYPLAGDVDPSTDDAKKSAVVNLFYMNNYLHDLWYDHGFNEAAGNAQASNFGRGGVEGDAILAEGQDYSGRNNANMSTPADGGSPRMQMYLFDGLVKGDVSITAPASLAGKLTFSAAGFGASAYDVTGTVVLSDDGTAPTGDTCTAPINAAALAGNIALIDRGSCDFDVKVKFAQTAGATAVIVANNVTGSPITMGGDDTTVTIPAVMITMEDGAKIKASDSPVTVHLVKEAALDLDGTLDESVIAHEYFHHVSNRLVGNASGLSNNQGGGMGEGWSDVSALILTVRKKDTEVANNSDWQGAYAMGDYVTGEYYYGIRRAPYSTDFAKNPLTFKHIENGVALPTTAPIAFGQDGASNAEVHNTGEVWANMLWEAYAGFLKDGRYNFKQAKAKVQDYVIAGLKMTPNAPTLVEARDAILAAADATDDADFMIWATAFAKRGMGVGAVAPARNSTTNSGVVESYIVATPTP